MSNKLPRIYISAMETEVAGLPRFDTQADELLTKLSAIGYDVYWEKQFRDYEIIEREIAACDALIAIVDIAWSCSTWMASEVTWAMGHFGAMETSNPRMAPIPILLYPVATNAFDRFPFNHHAPTILSRNVEAAVAKVIKILPLTVGD